MGTFMYSDFAIGEARNKSVRSQFINFAPRFVSEIVLCNRIFVSPKFDAGELASASYGSMSPLTTSHTLHGSVLSGR